MYSTINLSELATQESAVVEWKENVADERKLVETVLAFSNDFLNLGGGYIVCGAKEITDTNGFKNVEYIGLTASRLEVIKKYITNTCFNPNKVNPPIIPKFEELDVPNDDTRKILVIIVDATSHAHTYKADYDTINKPRYFVRADSHTREANNGLLRELLRRKGQLEPWDKRINQKSSTTDIDEIVLRKYLQNMRLWSNNTAITDYLSDRAKIEEFIPPLLGRLGVDKPPHPKNFTLMVFGKSPIDFCAGAYAIFTIFDGIDKGKQQAETQWITGTIVEQANKLIELLNIESTIAIDKKSDNANQSKYPKIALKEAVVNATVHRDYELEQPIRVEVYSDRVEIYSPGGLPFNIDKGKFQEGRAKAFWRNQAFGRIFHKLNLAQHQGSGIDKIITAMKEEGCPTPVFQVDDDSVTCILPAHPRHRIMKQISEAESDIVIRDYPTAYQKLSNVLADDIYNYRALELFCEVNNLLGTPEKVLDLITKSVTDFTQIRPNTLVLISESLSLIKGNKQAENLSRQLLNEALNGRLEEKQLLKVAYTLRKIGDNKAVVDFVNKIIVQYPSLTNNAFLLDQKGRALIDLAKRCEETYNEPKSSRIRNRAKKDFEHYISEAQKVMTTAFENSENIIDKDFIQKALWYIQNEMLPFLTGDKKDKLDNRTLFVKYVPNEATEKDMEGTYSKYGKVEKITFNKINDYETKVAYVLFEDEQYADKAYLDRYNIKLHGQKIHTERYKIK